MYAVFEDGSRQYKVSPGTVVKLDYREVEVGARVELPRVLLYCDGEERAIGTPAVEGMRVVGEVVGFPSTKYVIQKFRRRKNSRRRTGHRQHFTLLKVEHILKAGQEAPPPEPKTEQAAPPAPESQAPESTTPESSAPESPAQG